MGSRRVEWIESKKRRGITRQVVSLAADDGRHLAVVVTEADDPGAALQALEESSDPFDTWLMERVRDLHGEPLSVEIVLDTAPRPGRWRGWRR